MRKQGPAVLEILHPQQEAAVLKQILLEPAHQVFRQQRIGCGDLRTVGEGQRADLSPLRSPELEEYPGNPLRHGKGGLGQRSAVISLRPVFHLLRLGGAIGHQSDLIAVVPVAGDGIGLPGGDVRAPVKNIFLRADEGLRQRKSGHRSRSAEHHQTGSNPRDQAGVSIENLCRLLAQTFIQAPEHKSAWQRGQCPKNRAGGEQRHRQQTECAHG